MQEIKYIEGDLFAAVAAIPEDDQRIIAIPHVCNNRGAWGAGFVIPLAKQYPMARQAYLAWRDQSATFEGSTRPFRLGYTQTVPVVQRVGGSSKVLVCNMIAQDGVGAPRPLRYNALARSMDIAAADIVREQSDNREAEIIAPLFGSGLAGGDWRFIEELIVDCWLRKGLPVTIHYLKEFLPVQGFTPPSDEPMV